MTPKQFEEKYNEYLKEAKSKAQEEYQNKMDKVMKSDLPVEQQFSKERSSSIEKERQINHDILKAFLTNEKD